MLLGRTPHAVLLVGPASAGKTTLALDLAAGLLCVDPDPSARPCRACRGCRLVATGNHPDLHRLAPEGPGGQVRIGAATDPDPGTVRHLIGELALLSVEGGARVAIVEQAHRLNDDAQNALLKTARGAARRGHDHPLRRRRGVPPADGSVALRPSSTRGRGGPRDRTLAGRAGIRRRAPGRQAGQARGRQARSCSCLRPIRRRGTPARRDRPGPARHAHRGPACSPDRRSGPGEVRGGARRRAGRRATPRHLRRAEWRRRHRDRPAPKGARLRRSLTCRGRRRGGGGRGRRRHEGRACRCQDGRFGSTFRRGHADGDLGLGRARPGRARDGGARQLRETELVDEIRASATALDVGRLPAFLAQLSEVAAQLDENVNPELALDVLALSWPRSAGPAVSDKTAGARR